MIITDLMEYVGKRVKVYFENGVIAEGVLSYVHSFSEQNGWKKPKHFYLTFKDNKEISFRSYHVKKVEEANE